MLDIIAQTLDIEAEEVEQLMNLSNEERMNTPLVTHLLQSLSPQALYESMLHVRGILDAELPYLVEDIKAHYQLSSVPLDSFMLVNWVIGFLNQPTELNILTETHQHLPRNMIFETIPHVLQILEKVDDDIRLEWQRAIALMTLFVGAGAS